METAEANRQAVLGAARRHFEEFGFHGSSLDAIAEAAGFSKGAVYSRFASKDDVFLAVLEDHIERRAASTRAQLDEFDDESDIAVLATVSIRASVATVAWQAALIEFRAHAWREPELNARYRDLHQRTIASIAGFMEEMFRRRGEAPPIPTGDMAVAGLAEGAGVVLEYMADPDIDIDRLIDICAGGLSRHLTREASG